jgi:hypothetical protein
MQNIPYIYWLKNKSTHKKYIGVRWARGCNPSDFWVSYFTSSPSVHKLITIFGKNDFEFKIIHTFKTAEEAILREAQYVKLAVKRDDYLNLCHFSAGRETTSKAGKIGGMFQKLNKLGIHKQTREERLALLKRAWAKQNELQCNPFTHASKELQAERGRRGGPKNKGFVWLTDGTKSIKYTKKMQDKKSINCFLEENPTYKRGRCNANYKNTKTTTAIYG